MVAPPEPNRFATFARVLADLDAPLAPGSRLLDLGCGSGTLVQAACDMGLDAHGCDFREWIERPYLDTSHTASLMQAGRLQPIETPYRLPFPDATFDTVISDQVFEHVQDWDTTLAELARVMKPGARFLHLFPARASILEVHVFVPFAGAFHPRWWLTLWAALGVRNGFQRGLGVHETVEQNAEYLRTMVNYLPSGEIARRFSRHFDCSNAEAQFMRYSPRTRVFLLPALYRTFWHHCVFGVKR